MKSIKVAPEDQTEKKPRNEIFADIVKKMTRLFRGGKGSPPKSILKVEGKPTISWNFDPKRSVRFKDQCKTEHPFLSVFSHEKRAMKFWKSIISLALSYEVWAFPFRLAFEDPNVGDSVIFGLDIASDSIFSLDMLIQLFEAVDTALKENEDPTVENQLIWSTIHYHLRTSFILNALCIICYYIATFFLAPYIKLDFEGSIDLQISWHHWLWWISTIPRMSVRGYRLYKSFSSASIDLSGSVHVEDGKNISMLILLSAHCIGCIFFFMSRLRHLDRRTWVSSIEDSLNVYHRFEGSLWQHYLLALFKGFSSISGVEFTLYLANNLEEQIANIVMILVQVYISALILGTIIHFLAIRDPLAEQAAQRVKDLRDYIQMYQIPAELEAKLLKGLEFQHRKMMLDNMDADLQLSQSLRSKVVQSKYNALLQKGRAKGQPFCGCNERFLHEMLVEFNVMYLMAAQEIFKKGDIIRYMRLLEFPIISAQEIFKKGDISRELLVVLDGSAEVFNDSGDVIAIVSPDVPDVFPCVGEVAFFLGIMQPYTVRANKHADVRVVALSRDDAKTLFKKFPDQLDIISENILRAHGLAVDGSYISDPIAAAVTNADGAHGGTAATANIAGGGGGHGTSAAAGGSDDDPGRAATREELHATIVRRREEAFASLIMAVRGEDIDEVSRLWLGGMETIKDYDGRTLLSYAAVAGAYKIVEFLLDVKADVNDRNRWGQTPLDEAVVARQQRSSSPLC